ERSWSVNLSVALLLGAVFCGHGKKGGCTDASSGGTHRHQNGWASVTSRYTCARWVGQAFYTRRTQRSRSALVPPSGRVRSRRADLGRTRRTGPGTGSPTKAKIPIPNRSDAEREPVRWSVATDPVSSQWPPCSYAWYACTEEVVSATLRSETTAVESPLPGEAASV